MRARRSNRVTTLMAIVLSSALLAAACGSGDSGLPTFAGPTDSTTADQSPTDSLDDSDGNDGNDADASATTTARVDAGIEVRGDIPAGRVDPRLLGTNVPAWIGPDKLDWPVLWDAIEHSRTTLLRFPGGSWSNHYHWWECENNTSKCFWTWALEPSDFLRLIDESGLPAMWTTAFNGTAQEAAALVAFFNGDVDNDHEIGVDHRGVDWGTVSKWARARVRLGYDEPVRVQYWEVGNEIYGAVAEAGPQCADWGWENVSTCDGREYVEGTGDQDGYRQFAAAMHAVDPDIEIGAVGTVFPSDYNDYGLDVLRTGAGEFDFYVIHHYGFGGTPELDQALDQVDGVWHTAVKGIAAIAAETGTEPPPVAATEYNLAAWIDGDVDALMTTSVNLFYMVEAIGEMAAAGVEMATQWNLINGVAESGADYGIVHPDTGEIYPQFFALRLWSTMAPELVAVGLSLDVSHLDTWASVRDDGFDIMVMNPTGDSYTVPLVVPSESSFALSMDQVVAPEFVATDVEFNGLDVSLPADLPISAVDVGDFVSGSTLEVPAWSVTVFHLDALD